MFLRGTKFPLQMIPLFQFFLGWQTAISQLFHKITHIFFQWVRFNWSNCKFSAISNFSQKFFQLAENEAGGKKRNPMQLFNNYLIRSGLSDRFWFLTSGGIKKFVFWTPRNDATVLFFSTHKKPSRFFNGCGSSKNCSKVILVSQRNTSSLNFVSCFGDWNFKFFDINQIAQIVRRFVLRL